MGLALALLGGLSAALLIWAVAARLLTPMGNSKRKVFDAIVILGTPADSDGNPTLQLLDRVTEGVREYERGVAPRLIVTGAAAHNRFVEAEVMARVAQSQGVPASRILVETRAQDTIQNACYTAEILKAHGWRTAEVVSGDAHMPRAAMIFSRLPLEGWEWRAHPAPDKLTSEYYRSIEAMAEILKTARYLAWSRWMEGCRP